MNSAYDLIRTIRKRIDLENLQRQAIAEVKARGLTYRQMAIEFNEKGLRRRSRFSWTRRSNKEGKTWTQKTNSSTARGTFSARRSSIDFLEGENSTGFDAPPEAARILRESIDASRKGQLGRAEGQLGKVDESRLWRLRYRRSDLVDSRSAVRTETRWE